MWDARMDNRCKPSPRCMPSTETDPVVDEAAQELEAARSRPLPPFDPVAIATAFLDEQEALSELEIARLEP